MMSVNRDIFIRNLGVIFAFSYFTVRGARIDDVTLATNAVLMHLDRLAQELQLRRPDDAARAKRCARLRFD